MLIEILTSSTGDLQSGPGDHLHSKQPFKITVFKLSFVDWVAVLLLLFAYDCALDHLLDFPVLPTSGRHNEGASRICEWETLAAISVNKGCCSHQAITPDGEPWGDSGWKQDACHQAVNHSRHPQWCTPRGRRMRKHRIRSPESWDAYQMNDFNEPKLLHLFIHRKALNTLT